MPSIPGSKDERNASFDFAESQLAELAPGIESGEDRKDYADEDREAGFHRLERRDPAEIPKASLAERIRDNEERG